MLVLPEIEDVIVGKDAGFSKVSWFYFRPNPHTYWRLGSISGKTNILIGALVLFQAKPTYLLAPWFYFRQNQHTHCGQRCGLLKGVQGAQSSQHSPHEH